VLLPALFCRPPSEPCVQVSKHTALQLMATTRVQVCAHPVPFFLSIATRLFPFPLSQALPRAVGYYGNSVAVRVSPGRRSRLDIRETFSVFRLPFRSLPPVRYRVLIAERVSWTRPPPTTCDGIASGLLREGSSWSAENWGSASVGFALHTGLAAPHDTSLLVSPLSQHASFPLVFPLQVGWVS
jgi:hypothetical protein